LNQKEKIEEKKGNTIIKMKNKE